MTLGQAISTCFSKYADFNGRAGRSEYWWFALFVALFTTAAALINDTAYGLSLLAIILPHNAVAVRRLHDIDKSGWWLLLMVVPLVNLILIYWYCQTGSDVGNRFGDPVIH